MGIKTPEERWEEGIEHHPKSLEVKKLIKQYDNYGQYSFGGDGDNGEDILYLLDMYFETQEN